MASKNLIQDIKNKVNNEDLIQECIEDLFKNAGTNFSTLEILTYIKLFDPEIFEKYKDSILLKMGLFFKESKPRDFSDLIFDVTRKSIKDVTKKYFTPIQHDIVNKIKLSKYFSFSSPTSTGKSHIFRYLLEITKNDIVIIVPSRALINEYYKIIKSLFNDSKEINVLTFIDKINTKNAKRNVFIVTPERTNELFKLKDKFTISYILFDEAQLCEDGGVRGLYYDNIIRRCNDIFTESKFVFAHPYINNPEVQFKRNNIVFTKDNYASYKEKNIGLIYYVFNESGNFFHVGIDSKKLGTGLTPCDYNPLINVIKNRGSALIYCSKAKIYDGRIFKEFDNAISLCEEINDSEALEIIDRFRNAIGASDKNYGDYRSTLVQYLKRGIVVHHGSLPLSVRTILEEFTQKRHCKLCFATSTLEQGINMPFDLVRIDKFTPKQRLEVKNLVGRAGRSTTDSVFDFGQVVIKESSKTRLRNIIRDEIHLDEISSLDTPSVPNDDYKEYKEALKSGAFNEEFNLTNKELERIQSDESVKYIEFILNSVFDNSGNIKDINFVNDKELYPKVVDNFIKIYDVYLGRETTHVEKIILETTIKILFWKIHGRTFKQILWLRYSYAANTHERQRCREEGRNERLVNARPISQFIQIPDKKRNKPLYLFAHQKAYQVDYDRIMYDTYDFLDKLIGFRLGDMYYAAFYLYGEKNNNEKSIKMSNYIKYGTYKEKEIWILRYGFEFDDMGWLYNNIDKIDEQGIKLKENHNLKDEELKRVENFLID